MEEGERRWGRGQRREKMDDEGGGRLLRRFARRWTTREAVSYYEGSQEDGPRREFSFHRRPEDKGRERRVSFGSKTKTSTSREDKDIDIERGQRHREDKDIDIERRQRHQAKTKTKTSNNYLNDNGAGIHRHRRRQLHRGNQLGLFLSPVRKS